MVRTAAATATPQERWQPTAAPAPTTPGWALVTGAVAAGALGLLALAAARSEGSLLAGVLVAQVLLLAGWLLTVRPPWPTGVGAVAGGAATVGAVLVAVRDSPGPLAGCVGLALLAALVLQMLRTDRVRVTEALAATCAATLVTAAPACWLAVRDLAADGRVLAVTGLVAAASTVLVGRLLDAGLPRPALAGPARRGVAGLVVGVVVGAAAGAYAAELVGPGGRSDGEVITLALAGAVAAAAGDLLAARGGASWPGRVAGLAVTGLLPLSAAGPVAYVTARLLG